MMPRAMTAHLNAARPIRIVAMFGCCLTLLSAAGCDFPGKPDPALRPVAAADVMNFDTLYRQNCAGCHGADGTHGCAPPLRDDLFRAIVPLDELQTAIADGRPGTPMSAFAIERGGTLTDAQIDLLAREIKGVSFPAIEKPIQEGSKVAFVEIRPPVAPSWGEPKNAAANVPPYRPDRSQPELTGREAERIRTTMFAAACAGCHGDHGQGGRDAGAINGHAFLSLASDQLLRRTIITGRPDLKMPNYATAQDRPPGFEPLDSNDISELVALLRYWQATAADPAPSK